MTAPERFAVSQIPLAPRAPSIHDPSLPSAAKFAVMQNAASTTEVIWWSSNEGEPMRRREFIALLGGRHTPAATKVSREYIARA
jgi:hypothetical protein